MAAVVSRETYVLPRAVAPDVEVFAVGDIHGRPDLLQALIDEAAGEPRRRERRVLVFLGDLVDRGADSLGSDRARDRRRRPDRGGRGDRAHGQPRGDDAPRARPEDAVGRRARRAGRLAAQRRNRGGPAVRRFRRAARGTRGAPDRPARGAARAACGAGSKACARTGARRTSCSSTPGSTRTSTSKPSWRRRGTSRWRSSTRNGTGPGCAGRSSRPRPARTGFSGFFVVHGHTPNDAQPRPSHADQIRRFRLNLDAGSGLTGLAKMAVIRGDEAKVLTALGPTNRMLKE